MEIDGFYDLLDGNGNIIPGNIVAVANDNNTLKLVHIEFSLVSFDTSNILNNIMMFFSVVQNQQSDLFVQTIECELDITNLTMPNNNTDVYNYWIQSTKSDPATSSTSSGFNIRNLTIKIPESNPPPEPEPEPEPVPEPEPELQFNLPDPIEISNWTDATFNQTYQVPSYTYLKVTANAKGGNGGGGYVPAHIDAYVELINRYINTAFPQFSYDIWRRHYYTRGSGGGGGGTFTGEYYGNEINVQKNNNIIKLSLMEKRLL